MDFGVRGAEPSTCAPVSIITKNKSDLVRFRPVREMSHKTTSLFFLSRYHFWQKCFSSL